MTNKIAATVLWLIAGIWVGLAIPKIANYAMEHPEPGRELFITVWMLAPALVLFVVGRALVRKSGR